MPSKQFVIVGGSGGIGLALTRRLTEDGHQVTVLSRTKVQLAEMEGVHHVACDVITDEIEEASLPETIHGLAYCPGSINLRPFRSLKPETFREDFELNVVGAVKCIHAAMSGLRAAPQSSILLFSTVAVGQGMPAHATVAASKGAIEGLTRSLAAELAPKVRVNCIAPALTKTPLTEKFFSNDERAASLADKYPMARTGDVSDMAAAGCFLLGPGSEWVTGQVIGVDGGMSTLRT